jgi:hypothetical protein
MSLATASGAVDKIEAHAITGLPIAIAMIAQLGTASAVHRSTARRIASSAWRALCS